MSAEAGWVKQFLKFPTDDAVCVLNSRGTLGLLYVLDELPTQVILPKLTSHQTHHSSHGSGVKSFEIRMSYHC